MSHYYVFVDPFMMPHMQVDKGAIKFILSGANVMCPGLTSPGARMTKVEPETVVVSFECLFYQTKLLLSAS
jgi:predicted RNA-binding protein (TIGR00451 family)